MINASYCFKNCTALIFALPLKVMRRNDAEDPPAARFHPLKTPINKERGLQLSIGCELLVVEHQWHHQHQHFFIFIYFGWFDVCSTLSERLRCQQRSTFLSKILR
jgi:hypothetical protein